MLLGACSRDYEFIVSRLALRRGSPPGLTNVFPPASCAAVLVEKVVCGTEMGVARTGWGPTCSQLVSGAGMVSSEDAFVGCRFSQCPFHGDAIG
jgi:hypothetical protein